MGRNNTKKQHKNTSHTQLKTRTEYIGSENIPVDSLDWNS